MTMKLAILAQNVILKPTELKDPMGSGQMLVASFITYINGIKTMQRAEPNSSWVPHTDSSMDWSLWPFPSEQAFKGVRGWVLRVSYLQLEGR